MNDLFDRLFERAHASERVSTPVVQSKSIWSAAPIARPDTETAGFANRAPVLPPSPQAARPSPAVSPGEPSTPIEPASKGIRQPQSSSLLLPKSSPRNPSGSAETDVSHIGEAGFTSAETKRAGHDISASRDVEREFDRLLHFPKLVLSAGSNDPRSTTDAEHRSTMRRGDSTKETGRSPTAGVSAIHRKFSPESFPPERITRARPLEETSVHIHIGRIEVRAVAPLTPRPPTPVSHQPSVTLEDYLNRTRNRKS